MKKIEDYTGVVVFLAVIGLGGVAVYYNNSTKDTAKQPTAPTVSVEPVVVLEPIEIVAEPQIVDNEPEPEVIDLPETVIVGRVDKKPFRHGTKMCQWWEDAGMRAVSNLDGWSESTCSGNTCFLLVHDADMPAYAIMASWLSEASKQGHDPRIDDIELSVFVYAGKKEVDHIIYFPERDVFESR